LARRASPFGGGGFQRLRLMPPTQCQVFGFRFPGFQISRFSHFNIFSACKLPNADAVGGGRRGGGGGGGGWWVVGGGW
jgi:hypothetical protein